MASTFRLKWLLSGLLPVVLIAGCATHNTEPANVTRINTDNTASDTANTPPTETGKQLFAENCATCHGDTGKGNAMMLQGKSVRFDDPKFQKMLTDTQIKNTIKNGRGIMPAFETTFNEKQLDLLVKYVRSLSKPQ